MRWQHPEYEWLLDPVSHDGLILPIYLSFAICLKATFLVTAFILYRPNTSFLFNQFSYWLVSEGNLSVEIFSSIIKIDLENTQDLSKLAIIIQEVKLKNSEFCSFWSFSSRKAGSSFHGGVPAQYNSIRSDQQMSLSLDRRMG